jgi:hypothetical protein
LPSQFNRIAPIHVHHPILLETIAIHDQALNKMIYVVSLAEFGAVALQTLQETKLFRCLNLNQNAKVLISQKMEPN